MLLPTQYSPATVTDFIGPATRTALLLQRAADDAVAAGNAPVKWLLNGEPGIGKSALAKFGIACLRADPKWSVQKLNGTQVKIEKLEEIAQQLWYRDLYGRYRIVWIEEADSIPSAAQVRFLTLMDDLPHGAAVICTSNCKVDEFVKRFQTRFKVYEVEPPTPQDIHSLLRKFLPPAREADMLQISTFACGNVRAALLDAELALQAA